jgi:peptide deformylase
MDILSHPNPALKAGTQDVDPTTDSALADLVRTMAETMYDAPGVGLAAPQIGVLKRIIVFDVSDDRSGLAVMCNPCIVEYSEETVTEEEGCVTVPVERSVRVTCEALTLSGEPVRVQAEDLLARVLQHEIDHLDGVLIIDRATPEDRKAALRRYQELQAVR